MPDAALLRKLAVVTGAGSGKGIGRSIALRLAADGYDIVITDVPGKTGLEEVANEIRARGVQAIALECNNVNGADVFSTIKQVIDRFGRVDVMVNNAGVSGAATKFTDIEDTDWDLAFQVNVRGTAAFCRAVLPHMVDRGNGIIINNASLCGLGALDAIPASYTATKFAVIGLTKAIALEYAALGVRCNAICPGVVNTALRQNAVSRIAERHGISPEDAERLEDEAVAMKRPAQPEEIAEAAAWLAGPASSYVTGIALPVAGGLAPGL